MQINRMFAAPYKLIIGVVLWICLGLSASYAFDVRSSFAPDTSSSDIFKFGFKAYKQGRNEEAVEALKFAAEKGHAGSQWKLGRMYYLGDGVEKNPKEAFRLFGEIADRHADIRPGTYMARFVANSFVVLGQFYEHGLDDAGIVKNRRQAQRYYEHAAFYFGDAEAQYQLARFHLERENLSKRNILQATRILFSSAQKGHPKAAAHLGMMLVEGEYIKRDIVEGLKFLTIALKRSTQVQKADIQALQERAYSLATDVQRKRALQLAFNEINK